MVEIKRLNVAKTQGGEGEGVASHADILLAHHTILGRKD